MNNEKITCLVEKYYNEVVELRHYFHMYPELAFKEINTANKVAETLKNYGIEVREGIAKTGVVGLIKGGKPGSTVLLRADMDALKVNEETNLAYKSKIPGVMHACGHDGHTAALLGTAMILNEIKDEISGNIKVLFQPAEEDTGGALPMIEEGVLENPKVDAAFGSHLMGSIKEGVIQLKKGPFMAAPDVFNVSIIGKGGHASMPNLAVDPISISAQFINELQTLVSRRISPVLPSVISVTTIHGGDVHNVIPNEVEMSGTIRTLDEEVRKWIPEEMENLIKNLTKTNGATYEFKIRKGFPPLVNDEEMTDIAARAATKVVGKENVDFAKLPNMGSEDFAYFCKHVPSTYFYIGIAKNEKEPVSHHHPEFQWDDKNLKISMQAMAQVALEYLNNK
jgi:amidohydrolase